MRDTFLQPKIGSSLLAPPSVVCSRCRVSVPKKAIELIDRCIDPFCPLKGLANAVRSSVKEREAGQPKGPGGN